MSHLRKAEFLSELTPIPIFSIQIHTLCFYSFWSDQENYYNIEGNHIIKEQTEKQLQLELNKKKIQIYVFYERCVSRQDIYKIKNSCNK